MEIPVTVGFVGIALLPVFAAVGALAALVNDFTIVVVKKDDPERFNALEKSLQMTGETSSKQDEFIKEEEKIHERAKRNWDSFNKKHFEEEKSDDSQVYRKAHAPRALLKAAIFFFTLGVMSLAYKLKNDIYSGNDSLGFDSNGSSGVLMYTYHVPITFCIIGLILFSLYHAGNHTSS